MILVVGSNGFIGKHIRLYAKINDLKKIYYISKKNFNDIRTKKLFQEAETIIHLAGINKKTQGKIYQYNTNLTKRILVNCKDNSKLKKFIFTSSVKTSENTPYGKSKKASEKMINIFFKKKKTKVVNLSIPNIFGEFCKQNYNSVIATYCYNLFNEKKTIINSNNKIILIYVGDLVKEIFNFILLNKKINLKKKSFKMKLGQIISKIDEFYLDYISNIIPVFNNKFEINLYNTLKSYAFPKKKIIPLKQNKDHRGVLTEIIKSNTTSNFFTSITKRNKVRGNHFHSGKIEKFIVIEGKGLIKFRNVLEKKIYKVKVSGSKPVCVDIPNYFTHNIQNISKQNLITLFYSNEFYNPKYSDTHYEKV